MNNILFNQFTCSGQYLRGYVRSLPSPVGIEIGCESGKTTKFLLESNPNLRLYSIDPFESYVDWNGSYLNRMEVLHDETMKILEPFSDRFILYRTYSDKAIVYFEDESIDFIFIDGLHTYEQVLKDCINYYPKIKKNGLFSGHDYTAVKGVGKAVDKFANKVNKQVNHTECDVWFWYK